MRPLELRSDSSDSDAPGRVRWRSVLVIAQIAMSLVLLVGAGLFLKSWQQMLAIDPGFGRDPAAILSVMMAATRSNPDEAVQRAILKASPLPRAVPADLFQRNLELRFRPLDRDIARRRR